MAKLILGIVIGLIIVALAVRHTDFFRQKEENQDSLTTTASLESEKGDISGLEPEAGKQALTTPVPLLTGENPGTDPSNQPSETMIVTSDTAVRKVQGDGEKGHGTRSPEEAPSEPAVRETQEVHQSPEPIRLTAETPSDAAPSTPQATTKAEIETTVDSEQGIFYLSRYRFNSRSRAEGFKSKIEKEIGMPLVLHRTPSGDYEVGFAYTDEEDKNRKIEAIEQGFSIKILETSS